MLTFSPTFLDSFRRYQDAEDEWKDKARRELIDRLNGIETEVSEAARRGKDFEMMLCARCDGSNEPLPASLADIAKTDASRERLDAVLGEMAAQVRGGLRQVRISARLTRTLSVIGYVDFLKRGTVYDCKTTQTYNDDTIGKYGKGFQHRAYLTALHRQGIDHFRYLITDFKDVYAEDYYWRDEYEGELIYAIREFMAYLHDDDEMRAAWIGKIERQRDILRTREVA